jgi:hypothetical protein
VTPPHNKEFGTIDLIKDKIEIENNPFGKEDQDSLLDDKAVDPIVQLKALHGLAPKGSMTEINNKGLENRFGSGSASPRNNKMFMHKESTVN